MHSDPVFIQRCTYNQALLVRGEITFWIEEARLRAPVSGEEAYDTKACYESMDQRGARTQRFLLGETRSEESMVTPLKKLAIGDAHLRQIQQHDRYAWRVASGCIGQNLAKNTVFRFTCIFGLRLRVRRFDNQKAEGMMKCDM